MDIVRVADKLKAFRSDFPATEYGLRQSFTEDFVGDQARVIGHCEVVDLATGQVMSAASGTRALRAPIPNAQGAKDTRDPDRAMTQALGRCLGLMGYADAESIEGDTDEPDESRGNPATAAKKLLQEVSTDQLKKRLNDLAPAARGKARASLERAGVSVPFAPKLSPPEYDQLAITVDEVLDRLEAGQL